MSRSFNPGAPTTCDGAGVDIPLRLSPELMRELGHRAVDEVVSHLAGIRDIAVGHPPNRDELDRLVEPLPRTAGDPIDVLRQTVRDVSATITHTDHPRFMAYVPGPSNYVGAVADFLAAGLNVFAGHGLVGPGPAVIEQVTVDWLRRLCGLPDTAGGLFVSGGTMANLVAVHAARVRRAGAAPALIYLTDHAHRSVHRGLGFLGVRDAQIRVVPHDAAQRMSTADLATMIQEDRRAGHRGFCVVATAGTTSTGAVDPLDEIATICAENELWFHVDGAFGAAAVLTDTDLLTGLDRADSIALDPHKWWFQPYEAGCVLVRDITALSDAFSLDAEYLRETRDAAVPQNFYDLGPQLTRSFRALKVWMSMKTFGIDAFRRAVEHGIALVEHAERVLRADSRWQVVTSAQLAVITFRPRSPGRTDAEIDALTRHIVAATRRDGNAVITTTELDGRPVLRLCALHPEATTADVEAVIELLARNRDLPQARDAPATP